MFQTGNHEIIKDGTLALADAVRQRFEQSHDVIECLGTGRVTEVYLLKERATGQLHALKVLNARCRHDLVVKRRFARTCVALSDLRHENILRVLAIAPLGFEEPYLLTRYLGRNSLAVTLSVCRSLHESDVVSLFYALSRALHFAHEHGVVHGGLEPTDVFVLRGDFLQLRPVIADFGMSLVGADFNSGTSNQALTGESFGNVRYMSPEQCRGELPSASGDIYSLGCLMFEALTGQPVFALGTSLEVMLGHTSGASDFLVEQLKARGVSAPLVHIVSSMLESKPEKRPASMGAVAARLKELLPRTVAPRPQKAPSNQSISASLKSGQVVRRLSDTSGNLLLRAADIPSVEPVDAPTSPAKDKKNYPATRARPPQNPGAAAQPVARERAPAVIVEAVQKPVCRIVESQDVEVQEQKPTQALESATALSKLLVASGDANSPDKLTPSGQPLSTAAGDGNATWRPLTLPLQAVLSNPYFVVFATVVAFVGALSYGRYVYDQIQAGVLESYNRQQLEAHTAAWKVERHESAGRRIDNMLAVLTKRYNVEQRMDAVNSLSDMVGLHRTVYQPERARFILLQPDRFALLVESGAIEVDEEVRDNLVELVHFLACDDIFGREYLKELLRANKHESFNQFVIDASCCPSGQRQGKSFDKLEEMLLLQLSSAKDPAMIKSITSALLASGAVPTAHSVDILQYLSKSSDNTVHTFARQMLKRYDQERNTD